jgi:hypothetical protein
LTLHFINSSFLLFIIPAAVFIGIAGWKNGRFVAWQKYVLPIISIICVSALFAGLSDPYIITEATQNQTRVFAVDISRSVSDKDLNTTAQQIKQLYDAVPNNIEKHIICFAT